MRGNIKSLLLACVLVVAALGGAGAVAGTTGSTGTTDATTTTTTTTTATATATPTATATDTPTATETVTDTSTPEQGELYNRTISVDESTRSIVVDAEGSSDVLTVEIYTNGTLDTTDTLDATDNSTATKEYTVDPATEYRVVVSGGEADRLDVFKVVERQAGGGLLPSTNDSPRTVIGASLAGLTVLLGGMLVWRRR